MSHGDGFFVHFELAGQIPRYATLRYVTANLGSFYMSHGDGFFVHFELAGQIPRYATLRYVTLCYATLRLI